MDDEKGTRHGRSYTGSTPMRDPSSKKTDSLQRFHSWDASIRDQGPQEEHQSIPDADLTGAAAETAAAVDAHPRNSTAAEAPVTRTPSWRNWSFSRSSSGKDHSQSPLSSSDQAVVPAASMDLRRGSDITDALLLVDASSVDAADAEADASEVPQHLDSLAAPASLASYNSTGAGDAAPAATTSSPAFLAAETVILPSGPVLLTPLVAGTPPPAVAATAAAAAQTRDAGSTSTAGDAPASARAASHTPAAAAEASLQHQQQEAAPATPTAAPAGKAAAGSAGSGTHSSQAKSLPLLAVVVLGVAAVAAVGGVLLLLLRRRRAAAAGATDGPIDEEDERFEAELAAIEAEEKRMAEMGDADKLSAEEAALAAQQAEAAKKEKVLAAALAEGDAEMARIDALGSEELGDLGSEELAALEAELAELEGLDDDSKE